MDDDDEDDEDGEKVHPFSSSSFHCADVNFVSIGCQVIPQRQEVRQEASRGRDSKQGGATPQ